MPSIAWHWLSELNFYNDIDELNFQGLVVNSTMPSFKALDLRRAYYCTMAYTDYLIGTVLQELNDLGLADSTIVSFIGDHGWQLGENGGWGKMTNFDISVHAPMMIHVPGVTDGGISTRQLTEFVDLFPTLVEAADLDPLPTCPENSENVTHCVEGTSMLPLIDNPSGPWKERVFSQFQRAGQTVMGYSMKNDHYRYTEWVGFSGAPDYKPNWEEVSGIELYDHQEDPEENFNQANNPELQDVIDRLREQLHAGWRHAHTDDFA